MPDCGFAGKHPSDAKLRAEDSTCVFCYYQMTVFDFQIY